MLCEQRWERLVIVPRLEVLAQLVVQALLGVGEKPEDVGIHRGGIDSHF